MIELGWVCRLDSLDAAFVGSCHIWFRFLSFDCVGLRLVNCTMIFTFSVAEIVSYMDCVVVFCCISIVSLVVVLFFIHILFDWFLLIYNRSINEFGTVILTSNSNIVVF